MSSLGLGWLNFEWNQPLFNLLRKGPPLLILSFSKATSIKKKGHVIFLDMDL